MMLPLHPLTVNVFGDLSKNTTAAAAHNFIVNNQSTTSKVRMRLFGATVNSLHTTRFNDCVRPTARNIY